MKRQDLKVGDEVAIGRDRSYHLARGIVVDLRSWCRVFDKKQGKAIDILRDEWVKGRHATSKWGSAYKPPQSGILVRIHDHGDVWSEPRIIFVREIRWSWAEEEVRLAQANEAEQIRRARVRQMMAWLDWLEIPYEERWGSRLDREITVSYEEIEKLYDRFQEARRNGQRRRWTMDSG